jgi:hypothetical protein
MYNSLVAKAEAITRKTQSHMAYNIKMDVRRMKCYGVVWINVIQDNKSVG